MLRMFLTICLLTLLSPTLSWGQEQEGSLFDRESFLAEQKEKEEEYDYEEETGGDFFQVDEERLRKQREREEELAEQNPKQKEFLKMLNKIRGDDEDSNKRSKLWGDFEDVSGKKPEQNFLKSKEVEVWRELRKPVPRKRAFENKMGDLEEAVNSLYTPNISGKNPQPK